MEIVLTLHLLLMLKAIHQQQILLRMMTMMMIMTIMDMMEVFQTVTLMVTMTSMVMSQTRSVKMAVLQVKSLTKTNLTMDLKTL